MVIHDFQILSLTYSETVAANSHSELHTGKIDQNHTKTIRWKNDGFLMVFS